MVTGPPRWAPDGPYSSTMNNPELLAKLNAAIPMGRMGKKAARGMH